MKGRTPVYWQAGCGRWGKELNAEFRQSGVWCYCTYSGRTEQCCGKIIPNYALENGSITLAISISTSPDID